MSSRVWTIYLSGEIHSEWRDSIRSGVLDTQLPIELTAPVTDHAASDDCGVAIFGKENQPFWKDHKGASINAIRTRTLIQDADVIVVRFGDKYRQWNAAFDAGYATAISKPLITFHSAELDHALKEVDAAAMAVARTTDEIVRVLSYVITGALS